MARHPFEYVLVLCCVFSSLLSAEAQTSTSKSPSQVKEPSGESSPSSQKETDPLAEVRRAAAVALVTSLADEARDYRDETLRVRVQARAAEALWRTDLLLARSLFNRAWEEASAVDKAGARRVEEERKRFLSGQGGPGFIPLAPNLRLEVLRFAARCDRTLGEEFLASLEEEKKEEATNAASRVGTANHWDPTEPPEALNKRLGLASLLLESGDVERALRFADPALARVTKPGIIFLYKLRQKNAPAADQRYAALLARTALDPSADANTISLLSSYAFTPLIFATVTRNGRAYGGEAAPAPDLSAGLRAAFFRTAAQVLLRPVAPPSEDSTSAGRAGTYFVIARLLPLFEQHASARVVELRAFMASLMADTPGDVRNDHAMLTAGFNSEVTSGDDAQATLNQLRYATSSDERDAIYVGALRGIAKADTSRAGEIVDKIENAELRRRARAFVDFAAMRSALERKNAEEVLRIIRAGNLSSIQRVWAYTELARLLGKSDPARVLQLLNDATIEARRIDQSSPEHAQALIAIATRFLDVDRVRSWEMMAEAVKAAGHANTFTGEDGKVTAHLQTRRMVATFNFEAPSFNLNGVFSTLAKDDLQRATELARGFAAEEPRAIAILSIARSVLNEKQERAGPQQR